jgi:hypothetical protein
MPNAGQRRVERFSVERCESGEQKIAVETDDLDGWRALAVEMEGPDAERFRRAAKAPPNTRLSGRLDEQQLENTTRWLLAEETCGHDARVVDYQQPAARKAFGKHSGQLAEALVRETLTDHQQTRIVAPRSRTLSDLRRWELVVKIRGTHGRAAYTPTPTVQARARFCRMSRLAIALVCVATPAMAAPIATLSADLDGDGNAETITLDSSGQLSAGAVSRMLAPATQGSLSFAVVEGHRVVVARLPKEAFAVEGAKLTPLFRNSLGFDVDRERERVVEVNATGIVRFWRAPGVRRCDGEDRLFVDRWSFANHHFVAAPPPAPKGTELVAKPSRSSPSPDGARKGEPLGAMSARPVFRFTAASADADSAGTHIPSLAAPRELEDDHPTAWMPGGGAGEWVVAQAVSDRYRVTGIAVVTPSSAKLAVRRMTVLLDGGRAFSFALLPGGARVHLPEPIASRCVALVVAEPPPAGPTAIIEARIFTDADDAAGLEHLVAALARDEDATAAAAILERDRAAAPALAAALATAVGTGRRRIIELLATMAVPSTAPAVVAALRTASSAEEPALLAAIARLGEAAVAPLESLLADETVPLSAHQTALAALARIDSQAARAALIRQIGRGPLVERRDRRLALRPALSNPVARAELTAAVTAALADPGTPVERAVDLVALAAEAHLETTGLPSLAARIDQLPDEPRFAERQLLLQAIAVAGPPAKEISPWLESKFAGAGADVLRTLGLAAKLAVDEDSAAQSAALGTALADASPRVRRAAVLALASHPQPARETLLRRAFADTWPLVRRAAAEATLPFCTGARSSLLPSLAHASVADPSHDVRLSALTTLGACAPLDPAIPRVLENPRQPATLRERAAVLLVRAKAPGTATRLAAVVRTTLDDPTADEQSTWLVATCLRGLGQLGDRSQPVLDAVTAAATEPLSSAVRAAAIDAVGSLCPKGARRALTDAASDPDPNVRRAAARAAEKCR